MATDPFLSSRETHGPREPSFKASQRQLGVIVILTSLTVLFVGSIVAYLLTRAQSPLWRTARMPGLPIGLLGSTALLFGLSAAMHRALGSVKRNQFDALTRALWLALFFAVGFLLGQAMNWHSMSAANLAPGVKTLYAFTFFMLTGLHAVHVLGGFVPLGIVIARARRREYTSSRHEGVKFCVQYWDFLLVVWLVLLLTLYLAT
jgi:heme/copper-type cytochrome/quinol oxidase subunit 3